MSDFTDKIEGFVSKAIKATERTRKASALELFTEVIRQTPVDSGRARGGWDFTEKSPSNRVNDSVSDSLPVVRSDLISSNSKTYFLTNNVEYIRTLEYGGYPNPVENGTALKGGGFEVRSQGGFSKKAPEGMVRRNVKNWDKIVEKNARVFG